MWRWAWRSAGPPRQIEAVQGVVNALVAGTQEAVAVGGEQGGGDREQSSGERGKWAVRSWAWRSSDRPDPGRGKPVPGGGGARQLARARGDEDLFQDEAAAGIHGGGGSGRERD